MTQEYTGPERRRNASFSEHDYHKIAEIFRECLNGLFETLGTNVSTVEGRQQFHADLSFLRTARIGSGRVQKGTIMGIASAIVTGLSYVIYKGLIGIGLRP